MKISIVIPCYGSENTLGSVLDELLEMLSTRKEYTYEIILVNDCSPDGVYHVIKEYSKRNSIIKGISLAKNFGQHSALMAGYRASHGDVVVSMDDDGQTPVEALFSLIDRINEGYDVVIAAYGKNKHSIFRKIGTRINRFMARSLINMPKDLEATSFFAMRKLIVKEIIKYENPYPYVLGLILRTTNNVTNVLTKHRVRLTGKSGYTLKRLFSLWLNGFTAFSVKPLRIATVMGILFAFLGFASGLVIIINKLINTQVQVGWSSIMAITLVVGGMIMLMLGIIGEYVGRQYVSTNNSPQYVIREIIDINKKSENNETDNK